MHTYKQISDKVDLLFVCLFCRETALESKFCKTFLSFRIIKALSSTNFLSAIKTNYMIERGGIVRKVRLADFFKNSPFIFLIL